MKTKKEFFEFEKNHQRFFNDYYKLKNWQYKRIRGKENIKYDCLIMIKNKQIKIQEKARSEDYDDFLVELTQDISSNNKGWLYTCEADFLLYKTPQKFYWINMRKLKDHMKKYGHNYKTIISNKGWGSTLNAIVPWKILFDKNIGDEIKQDKFPFPNNFENNALRA